MLQDPNTYSKVEKNPINKMISNLKTLLAGWKKKIGVYFGSHLPDDLLR